MGCPGCGLIPEKVWAVWWPHAPGDLAKCHGKTMCVCGGDGSPFIGERGGWVHGLFECYEKAKHNPEECRNGSCDCPGGAIKDHWSGKQGGP